MHWSEEKGKCSWSIVCVYVHAGSLETCIATVSSNGQLKVASVSWPTPGPSHSTTATSQQQSQTPSHSVFRSQQLGGDLLCVTALHAPAVAAAGHAADGPASGPPHPLLLIGSHNQRVHVYDVGKGQLQGSFEVCLTHTQGHTHMHRYTYTRACMGCT